MPSDGAHRGGRTAVRRPQRRKRARSGHRAGHRYRREMDYVRWQDRPQLRQPVLIAAFEGWNDAADAASTAVRYLRERWSTRPFATIDHEDFYDYTLTRPQVRLVQGITRRIDWPETEFSA